MHPVTVRLVTAAIAVMACSAPRSALGAEPEPSRWDRPIALGVTTRLLLPELALSLDLAPVDWLVLSGSIGGTSDGPQEALRLSLRAPGEETRVSFGGGFSIGPYAAVDPLITWFDESQRHYSWGQALWVDAVIDVERRSKSGLGVHVFFGLSLLTNQTADTCFVSDPEAEEEERSTTCPSKTVPSDLFNGIMPTFGFTLSYAFAPRAPTAR